MNRKVTCSPQPFKCRANRSADPPQDCDWPLCGCDPYAEKVMEAISPLLELNRPLERAQPSRSIEEIAKEWMIKRKGYVESDFTEELEIDASRVLKLLAAFYRYAKERGL